MLPRTPVTTGLQAWGCWGVFVQRVACWDRFDASATQPGDLPATTFAAGWLQMTPAN